MAGGGGGGFENSTDAKYGISQPNTGWVLVKILKININCFQIFLILKFLRRHQLLYL